MTNPLGFYGIENDNQELEKVSCEDAVRLILFATLVLTIDKCLLEIDDDLKQFYGNCRDSLDRKLFKKYHTAITHRPKDLISWALQFVEW